MGNGGATATFCYRYIDELKKIPDGPFRARDVGLAGATLHRFKDFGLLTRKRGYDYCTWEATPLLKKLLSKKLNSSKTEEKG